MLLSQTFEFIAGNLPDAVIGPKLPEEKIQVPPPRYIVVIDLNGVLCSRSPFEKGKTRIVHPRPGCAEFLNFVNSNAKIVIWSSANVRNVTDMVNETTKGCSFNPQELLRLTQDDCTVADIVVDEKKPLFLKDLTVVQRRLSLSTLDHILLVDDTPTKSVLNVKHTAIHPPTWKDNGADTFLDSVLRPWLRGLFESGLSVKDYVKTNPLTGGQQLPSEEVVEKILKSVRRR
jgi:hypothetical protein